MIVRLSRALLPIDCLGLSGLVLRVVPACSVLEKGFGLVNSARS